MNRRSRGRKGSVGHVHDWMKDRKGSVGNIYDMMPHKGFEMIDRYCSLISSVEKSHRSPSDLETRIAHRPKDTVTLGFVGHKSNLTGRKILASQSKNFFRYCEKDKKSAYFPSFRGVKVAFG